MPARFAGDSSWEERCVVPRKLLNHASPASRRSTSVCLAIPGRVVKILDDANRLALIDVAGVTRTVNVGLLDGDVAGTWVLIHAGFALSKIDEREALATLELLEQMGADYEQELRELRSSAII
jgi:hydrogenase expression/formation protein HypC